MIPLRDNIRSSHYPIVNTGIIVACVVVFFAQLTSPDHGLAWAFVPHDLVSGEALVPHGMVRVLLALLASVFMHGGFMHIGSNMLFLWVFGDNVEDRMGHVRYLAFYLLSGVAASLVQSLFSGFSTTPLIGASGAIAGVLGAYLVLFRYSTIRALVFFFLIFMVDISAPVFIIYWFILQLFSGVGSIGIPAGIAYWAHIGGFGVGYLLVRRFARPLRPAPPADRPVSPRVTRFTIE